MKPMTAQLIDTKGHHLERLRELLLAGVESQATPVNPAYFEDLRKRILRLNSPPSVNKPARQVERFP